MLKFRVLIHGVNFQIRDLDKDIIEPLGFYVSAFVEADSPQKAESIAIELVRAKPGLRESVLNPRDDAPRMFVEEIEEISDWPVETARPLTGFAFYNDPNVLWRKKDECANL